MKKIMYSLGLVLGFATVASAQKIMLLEGDLTFLKGETELNVVYDFSALEVGDYPSEKSYKDKRIKELNEKEAGRGDKWSESWERDKEVRFPEKFEELLEKGLAGNKVQAGRDNDKANYTLIIKTKFIEPGYNVGVMSKPAAVSYEYIFVDKNDEKKILAKLSQKLVPGAQAMGMDFDTGTRISESYAKAGKMLAAFIIKNLK
ncbi:hypothetical protein [Fluviicola sp.]|uniref:hypothetical protein n=1 Tax=Fluviicola sp. TaxID=1917219 RepID=UPI00261E17C7|nr:hypothetical protein [Fluviicola sp.]